MNKTMKPEGVPDNAVMKTYHRFGGTNRNYYTWTWQGGFYWYALGNSGEAPTSAEADHAARRYIRDSQ